MTRRLGSARIMAAALCAALAWAVLPAAADTQVGAATVSGHAMVGYRGMSGDFNAAKFNEYRSIQPGMFSDGQLLFEDAERAKHLELLYDYTSENDQTYHLRLGSWGWWGVEGDLLRFPHNFSSNARTVESRGYDGTLMLPGAWTAASGLAANVATYNVGRQLGYEVDDAHAGAFWNLNEQLQLDADYHFLQRKGTKPLSIGSGFTNFLNIAAPVDQRTYEVSAGLKAQTWGWNIAFDYTGSFFRNNIDAITVDNPIVDTDMIDEPSRFQLAAEPDNDAHYGTISLARVFDQAGFPISVALSTGYGRHIQRDDFLPYTINSALPPMSFVGNLDGRVDTWLVNANTLARPTPRSSVQLNYRYYSYNTRHDKLYDVPKSTGDQDVDPPTASTNPNTWSRHNVDLEGSYRLDHGVKLAAGWNWERFSRDTQSERRSLNEYLFFGKMDWRASRNTWLRVGYNYTFRNGSGYDPAPGEFSEKEKYNLADLQRHRVDVLFGMDPCETFGITVNGGFVNTKYNKTDYGALSERYYTAGIDAAWSPRPGLTSTLWYTYDYGRIYQRSRVGGDGGTLADDWISYPRDEAHNVGLDTNVEIIPETLTWELGFFWEWGTAETPARGDSGGAMDFPRIKDWKYGINTVLDYALTERISLLAEYRWEKGHYDDFQRNIGLLQTGGDNLYLGQSLDDYSVHVLGGGVRVDF